MSDAPYLRPKASFAEVIDRIKSTDSPVGIDAQYTHAIIITYLQRIERRIEDLERRLK